MFILVNYKYSDLYNKQHIDKQIKIIACDFVNYGVPESKYAAKAEYEGKVYLDAEIGIYYKCKARMSNPGAVKSYGWDRCENEYELLVFKNKDIHWENFELSESLCSESELRFGCCEASTFKIKVHNNFIPLKDKWLTVTETLEGNTDVPFQFGRYKVFSDIPTADRLYREITAYDAMYDIINSSAISWYNTILPNKDSKVTMKQFRTSFVEYFGLKQKEITLANDDMIIEKRIQVGGGTEIDNETEQVSILKESSLSGLNVIRAICEINGCFGHIGRDGKFQYIYLQQDIMGLYPSNTLFPDHAPWYLAQSKTGHLYPQEPKSTRLGVGKYKSCQYEDFICKRITKLQIRQEENDIGRIWPEGKPNEGDNCYIIENNFLVYGKSSDDLAVIAQNIFDKITDIVYRPFSAECVGNPCLEVGDPVRLSTKYELVETYILSRILKGIQSIGDTYDAAGTEKYSEKVNGVHQSIIQLKGKANILKRTIEETQLEMRDADAGLSNIISVTAQETREEIKNTKEGLETKISKTVKSIEMSVSNDKTGKTAEVKLLITDEGGTQYEVVADKIDLTGLVSFTNLETGGQTVVNGSNITTGEINCNLLNGGEINGQKIVGGEVNGATVKAKEGLYLQYTNNNIRPPISGEYVFAKTGYDSGGNGGASNDSFLNIDSPSGTVMIAGIMALHDFDVSPSLKFANTIYFPGGFITSNAQINALQETHRKSVYKTVLNEDDEITASVNSVIKVFGVFVCIYGTYQVNSQRAGEAKYFQLGDSGDDYIPKWAAVRTVSSESGKMFMFTLDSSGRFIASNKSGSNITSSISMTFRFDFIRT